MESIEADLNIANPMANRLAQSASLYLRKHGENPIDWWPWCPEALETAKTQQKPIFLSIGYSSCHWCTVMEGEAFSDGAIAHYLNEHFLPIKVDREERPDVDSIYMQALQMMIGQGGWPLNIFLDSRDLVPFYGGTYFPVDSRYGRPGFLEILRGIHHFYHQESGKLAAMKDQILQALHHQNQWAPGKSQDLTLETVIGGLEKAIAILSRREPGPNFPMIPYGHFCLRGKKLLDAPSHTVAHQETQTRGQDLILGGIFDHVGGGFHRYTVDHTWTVPHFEKMLYDNGQIMEYLVDLWSDGPGDPNIERAIALTVQWLQREMTAPEGYFYGAQDADSFPTPTAAEPEEGAFYGWRYEALTQLLTPAALAALKKHFDITPEGHFDGQIVLQRGHGQPLDSQAIAALQTLYQQRYGDHPPGVPFLPAQDNHQAQTRPWPGRIPPVTDTKMIVAWNSLMISGLARAHGVFGELHYLTLAQGAAQFILDHQWQGDRFHRLHYGQGVAVAAKGEDYAFFIKALLDLHQVDPDPGPWLAAAIEVQAEFDRRLWTAPGGYCQNDPDHSDDLIIQERDYYDNANPSANGVAIANLIRLGLITENQDYHQRAQQGLEAFGEIMAQRPQTCPTLLDALAWFHRGTSVKVQHQSDRQRLQKLFLPHTVAMVDPALPSGVVGLVCRQFSCLEPATSWPQFQEQLQPGPS